jgi:hypothetical protein
MKLAVFAFAVALTLAISRANAADPLIVHEWGTFTCLQDETGRAIGAINSDDEPVPAFVHHAAISVANSNAIPLSAGKFTPVCYPPVTMRLETPVVYFHLPQNAPPTTVSVRVAFHGGWLTEFYPNADVTTPGVGEKQPRPMQLTADTVGTLAWPAVRVGTGTNLPVVDDKVWATPRQVQAACVTVGGESEDFLFYRGVGHLDSPVRVSGVTRSQLSLLLDPKLPKLEKREIAHSPFWLVSVTPSGLLAWTRGYIPSEVMPENNNLIGGFETNALTTGKHEAGVATLHTDMKTFLVKAGLFPDEAEAMLNTWQISYFKSPGTRLFYLVPRSWTDEQLPLHISGHPQITRVMVGRIEIVTPELRNRIRQIEANSETNMESPALATSVEKAMSVGEPLDQATKSLSPADRAYVLLGRFRDPILIDEQAQRPNPVLADFMYHHGIVPNG